MESKYFWNSLWITEVKQPCACSVLGCNEFELKFLELKRFRVEPSWGASIFELNLSCQYLVFFFFAQNFSFTLFISRKKKLSYKNQKWSEQSTNSYVWNNEDLARFVWFSIFKLEVKRSQAESSWKFFGSRSGSSHFGSNSSLVLGGLTTSLIELCQGSTWIIVLLAVAWARLKRTWSTIPLDAYSSFSFSIKPTKSHENTKL